MKSKKIILTAGYYGFGNLGDESILGSIINNLLELDPGISFCIISNNPSETRSKYNVDSIKYDDLDSLINWAKRSDLLMLGGGGLFQDYWGANSDYLLTEKYAGIPFYASIPLLAKLLNKPVALFSIGVGPLYSENGKNLTKFSFENASIASVRDNESLSMLKSLGLETSNIIVSPDPAFTIPMKNKSGKEIIKNYGIKKDLPTIGVCLRNWNIEDKSQKWRDEICQALYKFSEKYNSQYIFIPFQINPSYQITNDLLLAKYIVNNLERKNISYVISDVKSPETVAGLLGQCKFIIGMRLHSIILSSLSATPSLGIAYDPKIRNLFNDLNLNDLCINLNAMNASNLFEKMEYIYSNTSQISHQIKNRVDKFQTLVINYSSSIINLLNTFRASKSVQDNKNNYDFFINDFAIKQTSLLYKKQQEFKQLSKKFDIERKTNIENRKEIRGQNKQLTSLKIQSDQQKVLLERLGEEKSRDRKKLKSVRNQNKIKVHNLETKITELLNQNLELSKQLDSITGSTAWPLLIFLWKARLWLMPKGGKGEKIFEFIRKFFKIRSINIIVGSIKRFLSPIGKLICLFRNLPNTITKFIFYQYVEVDNSIVKTFGRIPSIFSGHPSFTSINHPVDLSKLKVSLISVVKNEIKSVSEWIKSIEKLTFRPNEIIVIDGGSTDGTWESLKNWASKSKNNIHLFINNSTIAANRNLAIYKARNNVIAVTDFGCIPNHSWLENIVRPFVMDKDIVVSSGVYDPIIYNKGFLYTKNLWSWSSINKIDPQTYLPPGGSMAFTKQAWQKVGGYPEWLSSTGEDTYFDLELKKLGGKWAFVPEAVVQWEAPNNVWEYIWKMQSWAYGDGESGIHSQYYFKYLCDLLPLVTGLVISFFLLIFFVIQHIYIWFLILMAVWIFLLYLVSRLYNSSIKALTIKAIGEIAQVTGFIRGNGRYVNRLKLRLSSVNGLFFILSGIPIEDTGGGSRGAQFALELMRRNYGVVYINKFQKQEVNNLHSGVVHQNLYTWSTSDVFHLKYLRAFINSVNNKPVTALIEHPINDFIPMINLINQKSGVVIYDLIDEWKSSLGADWFSIKTENKIILKSDIFLASSKKLESYLKQKTTSKITFLPNAVNLNIFKSDIPYPLPKDFPKALFTLIYVGALWGDWFNWRLLTKIAENYSKASVVIIGDYRNQCMNLPKNIHFLGLKPQADLPSYLKYSNIAIIPWKISAITQATSPLKIYEYLAMKIPVVAPNLPSLINIHGVFRAKNDDEFIRLIQKAKTYKFDEKSLSTFIQKNNWKGRVDTLIELTEKYK